MSEFKPGDVGMVGTQRWMRLHTGDWINDAGSRVPAEPEPPARRLVVIDPEDREQVNHLASLLRDYMRYADRWRLAAALREFANPTPPRCNQHLGIEYADNKGRVYSCAKAAGHDGHHEDADEQMTWTVRDA
jgi:hypothetical protein